MLFFCGLWLLFVVCDFFFVLVGGLLAWRLGPGVGDLEFRASRLQRL